MRSVPTLAWPMASAALVTALLLPGLAPAQQQAPPAPGAVPPGPRQSALCITCHGEQGISTMPDVPHLAGQPEIYLREQLRAYRTGRRQHEVMGVVAKQLSDADIAELSSWFSSFEIEARARAR